MTDNIDKIGIAIWGVKGGFRVFCSQGIDIRHDEVVNTMKDIRNFIRMNNAGIDFYALEFTRQYKVYTLYRSVDESNGRSGAFIAITLFIPHPLRLVELRPVLLEMMDTYFKEYIDPVSNMPLAGKYDDISPFVTILGKYQARVVAERGHFVVEPSQQNNLPKVFPYVNLDVVDKFFDTPYRAEFYNCQEVMFLDEKLVNNPTLHHITFGITFHRFDPDCISEQIRTGMLSKFDYTDCSLVLFKKNEKDVLSTYSEHGFSEEDRIELRFCKPYHADNFFEGTLGEAIEKGIFRKQEGNYRFAMPRFKAENYIIPMVVEGIEHEKVRELKFQLYSDMNKVESEYDEKGGSLYFTLQGESITKCYGLSYKFGDSVFAWGESILPEEIKKSKSLLVVRLKKYTFQLAEGQETTYEGKCLVAGVFIPFCFTENKRVFSVWLPDHEKYANVEFNFQAEGYTSKVEEGGIVSFAADFVNLVIRLSQEIPPAISKKLSFSYRVGGKEYSSSPNSSTGELYFKIPKGGEEREKGDLFLLLQGNLCECTFRWDYPVLSPELKLYDILIQDLSGDISFQVRTSSKTFEYIVDSDVKNILIPQNAYMAKSVSGGNLELAMGEENLYPVDNGLLKKQTIRLYRKYLRGNDFSKLKEGVGEGKKSVEKVPEEASKVADDKPKEISYLLYSKLGKGFFIPKKVNKRPAKYITLEKESYIRSENLTKDHSLLICDRNGEIICEIAFPAHEDVTEGWVDESNEKYRLQWGKDKNGGLICTLDRKRSKYFLGKISDKGKKIFFFSIVSLAFIIMVTALSVWYIKKEQPVAMLTIQVKGDNSKVKDIQTDGFKMKTEVMLDSLKIYLFDKKAGEDEIEITGEEKLTVKFESEGDSVYEIESFKNNTWENVKKTNQVLKLWVVSPGRVLLKNSTFSTISEYENYAKKYSNLEKDFAEKAWNEFNLAESQDDSLLKDYQIKFSKYHMEEVRERLDFISQNKQTKDKVQELQKIWDKLNEMSCSIDTVGKVETAFQGINDDILKKIKDNKSLSLEGKVYLLKIDLYKRYFKNGKEGGAMDEMKGLLHYPSYFTDAQYAVIKKCFLKDTNTFTLLCKKNFKTFADVENAIKNIGGN